MALTQDPLLDIGARAATLWERVGSGPTLEAADPAVVEARIARWRHVVADGDPVRFRRYLRWCGLDERSARAAVSPLDVRHAPPPWLDVLEQATRDAADSSLAPDRDCRAVHRAHPEPFADAIRPFIRTARRRVLRTAALSTELTDQAYTDLAAALLARLARIADRTLFAEFAAFRAARLADPSAWHTAVDGLVAGGAGAYHTFVRHLLSRGFVGIFARYPVLARVMAQSVSAWVDATVELAASLARDRPLLERTFAGGAPLGPLIGVVPDLSDRHRGGRTVCRVRFANGRELVYKPRSTGPESAFRSLLTWLNDRDLPLRLAAPMALDCGTHGWTEALTPRRCASDAEIGAYYRRAGMLLCLTYVLGSADLHGGNLIACGEFPVLVDLEVVMSAPWRADAGTGGTRVGRGAATWDSVLRTGLLPSIHVGRHGRFYRGGALVRTERPQSRRWRHVNTDLMAIDDRPSGADASTVHLPSPEGRRGEPAMWLDEIAAGFRDMFDVLCRNRKGMTALDGPWHRLTRQRHRVILRSTSTYASLLDQVLHPARLRDGAEWSIELERLTSSATLAASRPRIWPALVAERMALERLDIPLFEADASTAALDTIERGTLPRVLAESGARGAARRLALLDEDDLVAQTQVIRVALAGVVDPPRPALDARAPVPAASMSDTGNERDRYVAAAVAIARRLRGAAIDAPTGEVNWMGVTRARGATRRAVRPLGWDLFGGRLGVALFFAALASVDADPGARALSLQVLHPLIRQLGDRGPDDWRSWLGAAGLGGVVYALARTAHLTGSTSLLDAATIAALRITPDMVERDPALDVVRGCAGALLGLLTLYGVTRDDRVLLRARWCGRRLLRGPGGSSTDRGFAHGSAGIAYGLARLYGETRERRYRSFVVHSWHADDTAASAAAKRDRMTSTRRRTDALRQSWCRGSSGVGLSRLACGVLTDTPDLIQDTERFVERSVSTDATFAGVDHACCGHAGRVSFLSAAARQFDRRDWMRHATDALDRMIDRASTRATYAVGAGDDLFAPGFFQGLAGIGYELLRIRFEGLPSVLLME